MAKKGPKPRAIDEVLLLSHVVVVESCWEWIGTTNGVGYGVVYGNSGRMYAHRAMYTIKRGPIPSGYEIDHLCRNRRCINPAHLEAVTHRENCLRGTSPAAVNAAKAFCPNGHPLSGGNLYVNPAGGSRCCRVCVKAYQRAYQRDRRKRIRSANND